MVNIKSKKCKNISQLEIFYVLGFWCPDRERSIAEGKAAGFLDRQNMRRDRDWMLLLRESHLRR